MRFPRQIGPNPDSGAQRNRRATTPTIDPALAQLGQRLFVDRNLSEPAGTACVACHQPARGWFLAQWLGFKGRSGQHHGVFGVRNPMSNAYQSLVPSFHFVVEDDGTLEAVGGHFWDGRAATLAEQALGPFLNPAEMNNPSAEAVVRKVAAANYANQFRAVFGADSLNQPATAFRQIGEAIASVSVVGLATVQLQIRCLCARANALERCRIARFGLVSRPESGQLRGLPHHEPHNWQARRLTVF